MQQEYLEEKLVKEWNLSSPNKITQKLLEGIDKGASLHDVMDGEKMIACAYGLGKILANRRAGLKSTQLRKFYEMVLVAGVSVKDIRGIENEDAHFKKDVRPQILKIKPQLAYAKKRMPWSMTPLFEVLNPLLDVVKNVKDYDKLQSFMEATVAYHKYCGARD